jgi:hypothetical protein
MSDIGHETDMRRRPDDIRFVGRTDSPLSGVASGFDPSATLPAESIMENGRDL